VSGPGHTALTLRCCGVAALLWAVPSWLNAAADDPPNAGATMTAR